MYKNYQVLIVALSITLLSCNEKGAVINTGDLSVINDTTYTTTAPTADDTKVLVEEYTGVTCVNCPKGTAMLTTLSDKYPDRVVIAGMHEGKQSEPIPDVSKYDFRLPKVLDLLNSYFSEKPNKPMAAVNRNKFNDLYFIDWTTWTGRIEDILKQKSKINLGATILFDTSSREATIRVKVVYAQKVETKQNISLYITESKLIDAQENETTIIKDYEHNHVLRDMITPISGITILPDNPIKEPGRVYERTFKYIINKEWEYKNCKIIVFVHNDGTADKEVLQCLEKGM